MDFQQGLITTIHHYGIYQDSLKELRSSLKKRPTSLLIPCIFSEFKRPALTLIKDVLLELEGLDRLVIALSANSESEVKQADNFFSELPYPVHIQWTDSPAVIELLKAHEKNGLSVYGKPGKGWAVWQGIGIASVTSDVIALFDADIRTFSPSYPARMLSPLLNGSDGVSYVKAFYSRISLDTNALQGRATRLFVGPLLNALEKIFGTLPYLQYLQAFRYPLAGEFAFSKSLAMNLRIPCDWGLEMGLLSEVYRHVSTTRIAQVDLGIFDHKHKDIGDKPNQGLQKMCSEIFASILRGLMEHEGKTLIGPQLSTLEVLYKRLGEDRVKQFGVDSLINHLPYNRHEEELAVQKFASLLKPAMNDFMSSPSSEQLPSWSKVLDRENRLQEDLAIAGKI
ncbi:glycosyl transferase [Prochlorococcus sp. MIT 1341]|uniref:glycosyl transferase n=1 Tax=Prochlorococcus sp. MIT 1341 TaxID=3096221 RepID=UPI002A75AAD1|nr:glycosyl transferase [Prochlorococcus sp. MIT 1341]